MLGDQCRPKTCRSRSAASTRRLIYNQQPLTLGEVLENDPTIRTTYGFGNAAEQFVIRGFALFGDDMGVNGLYGIAPRQLVAPELFEQVQVLNGASAFINGAAPGGIGPWRQREPALKRAGRRDRHPRHRRLSSAMAHIGGSFDVARRFGDRPRMGRARERRLPRWRGRRSTAKIAARRCWARALDYDGGAFRAALDLAYQDVRVDSLRPKVTHRQPTSFPRVPDADANYAQDYTYTELRDVFGTLSLEYDLAANVLALCQGGRARGQRGRHLWRDHRDRRGDRRRRPAASTPSSPTSNNEAVEAGLRGSWRGGDHARVQFRRQHDLAGRSHRL